MLLGRYKNTTQYNKRFKIVKISYSWNVIYEIYNFNNLKIKK